jgi:uncharacterized protein (DUF433 family)
MTWQDHIRIDPNIRFGKPCIKGTRIAVRDILSWLASEMSMEEILSDFPELTKADLLAALAYAAHRDETAKILTA